MDKQREISEYIENNTSAEDPVLKHLARETHVKALYPQMLSGHHQGKLLEFISQMIQPEYILEIGTYTGYSAICLAKAQGYEFCGYSDKYYPNLDIALFFSGRV